MAASLPVAVDQEVASAATPAVVSKNPTLMTHSVATLVVDLEAAEIEKRKTGTTNFQKRKKMFGVMRSTSIKNQAQNNLMMRTNLRRKPKLKRLQLQKNQSKKLPSKPNKSRKKMRNQWTYSVETVVMMRKIFLTWIAQPSLNSLSHHQR